MARLHALSSTGADAVVKYGSMLEAEKARVNNSLMAVARTCYMSALLKSQACYMLIEAARGSWSTLGVNIAGGYAVPSFTVPWRDTMCRSLLVEDDTSTRLAEVVNATCVQQSNLAFKIDSSGKTYKAHLLAGHRPANKVLNLDTKVTSVAADLKFRAARFTYTPGPHRTGDYVMLTTSDQTMTSKQGNTQGIALSLIQEMLTGATNAANELNDAVRNTGGGGGDGAAWPDGTAGTGS